MEHSDWIDQVGESVRAVAKAAGIPHRTLASQLEKGKIHPENVIRIAEALGVHPVGALVDTGYLAEKWARATDPVIAIRQLSDEQIADEVLRRMKLGSHVEFETPINELEQRRSNRATPDVDITQYDLVADSSPDEKEGDPSDYEA